MSEINTKFLVYNIKMLYFKNNNIGEIVKVVKKVLEGYAQTKKKPTM